jgi:hypothetical protein
MATNTKISSLITSQVPFFVRNDHENFVRFIEAYYEYMEQDGKAIERGMNLPSYYDIDRSIDLFVQKFYDQYLPLIPKDTQADKTLILKRIKDFYRARGTEKSINFLLRILFNEDADFYYPQRDVLRASAGKWFVEKSLKIFDVKVDGVANTDLTILGHFASRKITGQSSNNYAIVETAESYYEAGTLVRELKISNQYKEFQSGEIIEATFTENGVERTLTANIYSGIINSVEIGIPGTGYQVGNPVVIESAEGTGGSIIISSVTTGNVSRLGVIAAGAGFRVGDDISILGAGGSGAAAEVLTVIDDGSVHPNNYTILYEPIFPYLNVALNAATYGFTSNSAANANTILANALGRWVFANTGPILATIMLSSGAGYLTTPTAKAQGNTQIRNLGILGELSIEDGGLGYSIGEKIFFDNPIGSYGFGAKANVTNIAANGMITSVYFEAEGDLPPGGVGYNNDILPTANLTSTNGTGAIIEVLSVLGEGDDLVATAEAAGAIRELTILSGGQGYDSETTLNLASYGDGTATANAIVISGVFTYPGRYLNDDGHLSAYNFLQDRDYYQPFSYVIKIKQSIEKYRKALKDLVHPAGMKVFGEYVTVDEGNTLNLEMLGTQGVYGNAIYSGTFTSSGNTVIILSSRAVANGNLYIEFATSNSALLNTGSYDGIYNATVTAVETSFRITLANSINSLGTVYFSAI